MGEIADALVAHYSITRRRLNTRPEPPQPVIVKYVCVCCERESLDAPLRYTGRPTVRQIVKMVSDREKIPVDDIMSDRRNKEIVAARQIAMYLARHLTLLSTTQVGRSIGGRDHTTVIHGVRQVTARRAEDTAMQQKLAYYEMILMGGQP